MTATGEEVLRALIERVGANESLVIEFKLAQSGLPSDLWPTISAFANTSGGWVFLGVDDSVDPPSPVGVRNVEKRLEDFWNQLRNPQKMSDCPCSADDVQTIELPNGNSIIMIRVPAAERKRKPLYVNGQAYGGTYVRGHSGDHKCSKGEVDRMMREASEVAADSAIIVGSTWDAVNMDTFRRYRRDHAISTPLHPCNEYDDEGFLRAIGGWQVNRATGVGSLTVAGLLLLGTDEAIREWRGRHLIDYRLVGDVEDVANEQRWADRIPFEGNLYDAFHVIYPRLIADQPAAFQLQDGKRTDPAQRALREALANMLVHADYSERQASLIIRSPEGIRFRNPGCSRVPPEDLLSDDRSDPRNPLLMRMFRCAGLAEDAGTGIGQIVESWRQLGFRMPQIVSQTERNEFGLDLRYTHLFSGEDREWLRTFGRAWTEYEQIAMVTAKHEGRVDNAALRTSTRLHPADATKILTTLRDEGFLSRIGGGRMVAYELAGPATPVIHKSQADTKSETPNPSAEVRRELRREVGSQVVGQVGRKVADNVLAADSASREHWEDLWQIGAKARESKLAPVQLLAVIRRMCAIRPLSITELSELLQRSRDYLRAPIKALLDDGSLRMSHPDKRNHPEQRYSAPRIDSQASLFEGPKEG